MQRRRWTNLPMSEPTNPKSGEKRKPDDIRQNKHREEKKKIKRDFFFPQKFSRSEKKGRVGLQLAPTDKHTNKEPPRRISEALKVAATYSPTMQRSTIGDAELNDPVRNGKGWDLSAITTLIKVRG